MTDEQRHLVALVVERVEQMQRAVVGALPGARSLHEEFRVGSPMPTSPAGIVALGRSVAGPAKEYRALLLTRGLDAAALARFERALVELETLGLETQESAPTAPPAESPAADSPAPKRPRRGAAAGKSKAKRT